MFCFFTEESRELHRNSKWKWKHTDTNTRKREWAPMFSDLPVGSNDSFGLSRPKEHRQVHHNPPTSGRGSESGERNPDGGCAHNWYPPPHNVSLWKETQGKSERQKERPQDNISQKLSLHGTENFMMSAEGKFPLAKGEGIVRCQVTTLWIWQARNTQEVFFFFRSPTVERANNRYQYTSVPRLHLGRLFKTILNIGSLSDLSRFQFIKSQCFNVLILVGLYNRVVLFLLLFIYFNKCRGITQNQAKPMCSLGLKLH